MPLFLVERNFAEELELTAADVAGITAVNDDAGTRRSAWPTPRQLEQIVRDGA